MHGAHKLCLGSGTHSSTKRIYPTILQFSKLAFPTVLNDFVCPGPMSYEPARRPAAMLVPHKEPQGRPAPC